MNFNFTLRDGQLANILVGGGDSDANGVKGKSACGDGGGGECQVFALTDNAPVVHST